MDERGRMRRADTLVKMRIATRKVLTDAPPLPFGRIRSVYVAIVSVLIVLTLVIDAAAGRSVAGLPNLVVMLCAVGLVVGSWWHARVRRERSTLSGLWTGYALVLLRDSDTSVLEVSSLRILAAAENSGPPRGPELDEIEAQLASVSPERAASFAAYLRLREAAHDRRALSVVSRTMRIAK